ncbi:MAG: response regulator transcription factor [Chloroflexota bacterium]
MKTILVVDDNLRVRRLLDEYLSEQGYQIVQATDGRQALALFASQSPDLILLDVMMPKLDGMRVIRQIRQGSSVPIIMVTAKRHESDVVQGFELGADDYVIKPFKLRELLMRVRAVLRRTSGSQSPELVLTVGGLVLDRNKHSVTVAGQAVEITPTEFCLLQRLMASAEHTLTRAALSTHLIENGFSGSESTLKIHIRNLRGKIEPDASDPRYIETVFGVGYRLREV